MFSGLSKLCLTTFGWTVKGRVPESLSKGVLITAPHTSNWDFVWGQLALSVLKINSRYFAKKELLYFLFLFS